MIRLFRRPALVLACLLLTGCSASSLLDQKPAPQLYVLRPDLGPVAQAPQVNWQLAVGEPQATLSLNSPRIAIQRSSDTLDYYANAAWQDRGPVLVQRALVHGFEESGKIGAVAAQGDGVMADYILQTDLRRFEADYASPNGAPTVTVEIGARLIRAKGRSIVGSTVVRASAPATANSVPAAVAAFNTATGQAVEKLVAWTLRTPKG